MARLIVEKIDADPGLLEVAHENLHRWSRVRGRALPQCRKGWKALLKRPWGPDPRDPPRRIGRGAAAAQRASIRKAGGRDPGSETDLLNAHEVLMAGLLDAPGHFRRGGVVVTGAGEVHHIGPSADRVPHLMSDLLSWLGSTTEHPLIAGSVFHYEFEFIHPFEDGNGRMGRLWQTLIPTRWKPLFTDVPVESLIHARQSEYYEAIRESSGRGESTPFIAFMLDTILAAILSPQERLQVRNLLSVLKGEMSRRDILHALGLSDRKSLRQRYLLPALQHGYVEMTRPVAPNARNQKYRPTQRGWRVKQEVQ